MRRLLLFFVLAAVPTVAFSQGLDSAGLCQTCKPCQDFYKYVNTLYLNNHPIPPEYPEFGPWTELHERNLDVLHKILNEASEHAKSGAAARGSNEQKIGDFYASVLDSIGIERRGSAPLKGEFQKIDQMKNANDILHEIVHLIRLDVNAPFWTGPSQDDKNSERMMIQTWQAGLGLPDRDYYFRDDAKSKQLRDAYVKHIATMLTLGGENASAAKEQANKIVAFETKLASASMDRVERRNPELTYNDIAIAEANKLTPHIDWSRFYNDLGAGRPVDVNISQPKFMAVADSLIAHAPISDWKAYFKWQLLHEFNSTLPHQFVDEGFAFNKLLYGQNEMQARWKRAVRSTDRNLGEALGQEYVKVAFPPEAKKRMLDMISNLKEALRSDITSLSWIGDSTRHRAIEKLDAFNQKIGYPDKWRDYSSLTINRGEYFQNVLRSREFEYNRELNKLGKPVDRNEWGMTPPTINAYYNSSMNEIVFPAGILQPPFFDFSRDEAFNYGAIGTVIGHEMTHGFDDNGAKFDARGNMQNWWSEEDLKKFQTRAKCIIDQYSSYAVQDSLHLTGGQVVGESIADLGGVTLGYAALERSLQSKPLTIIGGFTPEQRFFLGYARQWAENMRPEAERTQVTTDNHPPSYFRVIGPLSNFPPFAQAFGCQEGDKMVRPASERCQIW